jgi:hypothetical protein
LRVFGMSSIEGAVLLRAVTVGSKPTASRLPLLC